MPGNASKFFWFDQNFIFPEIRQLIQNGQSKRLYKINLIWPSRIKSNKYKLFSTTEKTINWTQFTISLKSKVFCSKRKKYNSVLIDGTCSCCSGGLNYFLGDSFKVDWDLLSPSCHGKDKAVLICEVAERTVGCNFRG